MQGIRINITIFPLDTLKIHNVLYVLTPIIDSIISLLF